MRNRREQVQAYRFLIRRIVSALLVGEPETTELPMRRFMIAMIGGTVVAALLFAGFGVYGLLRPGGRAPVEGAIIVERETGARFIFTEGTLHPVFNWTSALLILGEAKPAVRTMARASLRDVPRGSPVGIADAPDSVPPRSALLGLPWSVCSAARSITSVAQVTHVLVGVAPADGTPVTSTGLLVRVDEGDGGGTGGTDYLLWDNQRLRIRGNEVLAALGWAGVRPVPVAATFLNAVPPGPDLVTPRLPDTGDRAPTRIEDRPTRIGQLFRAAGQSYVMVAEGLAPIGAVTARLLEATGRGVNEISAQDAGRALADTAVEPPGMPVEVPPVRGGESPSAMVCASYRVASAEQSVSVETFAQAGPELSTEQQTTPAGQAVDGVSTADRIAVAGGHAALVSAATPLSSVTAGNVFLVTDQGLKHPLPRENLADVQASLGYGGVAPVVLPSDLLALVPTGPALDPAAAALLANPATGGQPAAPQSIPTPEAN